MNPTSSVVPLFSGKEDKATDKGAATQNSRPSFLARQLELYSVTPRSLDGSSKHLLTVLLTYAGDEWRRIYPTISSIAERASMTEGTVLRLLGRLRGLGFVLDDNAPDFQTSTTWRCISIDALRHAKEAEGKAKQPRGATLKRGQTRNCYGVETLMDESALIHESKPMDERSNGLIDESSHALMDEIQTNKNLNQKEEPRKEEELRSTHAREATPIVIQTVQIGVGAASGAGAMDSPADSAPDPTLEEAPPAEARHACFSPPALVKPGACLTANHSSRRAEDTDSHFRTWYEHYPRREAPAKARRAYEKALRTKAIRTNEKPTHALLLQRLQAYSFRTDPKFIPHPATWLNDGCWQEPQEAPPTAPGQTDGIAKYFGGDFFRDGADTQVPTIDETGAPA